MRKHLPLQRCHVGVVDACRTELRDIRAEIVSPLQATSYPPASPILGEVIRWVRSYPNERILRLPQVVAISGRSRPSVWSDIANGIFPRPLSLGARARGWRESEVMGWIEVKTILARVDNPAFGVKDYVVALNVPTIHDPGTSRPIDVGGMSGRLPFLEVSTYAMNTKAGASK